MAAYWKNRQSQRRSLSSEIKDIVDRKMGEIALSVSDEIKNTIMTGERTGKSYKRGDTYHIASAPGEPPVTDSGQLVQSVHPVRKSEKEWIVTSIDDSENENAVSAEYAMYLELGTVNMRPRPFIEKSMKEALNGRNL